jgi:hypothetical protein
MHTDRDKVVGALRSRGDHDRAAHATCVLPRLVDTDKDAGVLHQLGISVETLEERRLD